MVSESGVGGEYDGGEEGKETKQHAHEHERDASISLAITRRTDGDGFSGRRLPKPHAGQAALHTLVTDRPPLCILSSASGHTLHSIYFERAVEFHCKCFAHLHTVFSNSMIPGSTKHGRVWTQGSYERIAGGAEADKNNFGRSQAPGTLQHKEFSCHLLLPMPDAIRDSQFIEAVHIFP